MNTIKLKTEFLRLVDKVNDESILLSFVEALKDISSHQAKMDIIDNLTVAQKKRLKESLTQNQKGKILSHEQMKREVNKWIGK